MVKYMLTDKFEINGTQVGMLLNAETPDELRQIIEGVIDQKMEALHDGQLLQWDKLKELVQAENVRQLNKWGVQTRTPFEWFNYLVEEVGEVAKAIAEEHYREGANEEVVKETIQVATLALKICEMYMLRMKTEEMKCKITELGKYGDVDDAARLAELNCDGNCEKCRFLVRGSEIHGKI